MLQKGLDPLKTDLEHTDLEHQRYAEAVKEVGKGTKAVVVDLFDLFRGKTESGEFEKKDLYTDGIHYTTQGYAVSAGM